MPLIGDVNPAWTDFTPTFLAESGTITSASVFQRYRKSNNFVILNGTGIVVTAGTGVGAFLISIPFPWVGNHNGSGRAFDAGGNGFALSVATHSYGIALWKYDGTTCIITGQRYTFSIVYETSIP